MEYSLILGLIFIVVILAVMLLGNQLRATYQDIACNVATHASCQ